MKTIRTLLLTIPLSLLIFTAIFAEEPAQGEVANVQPASQEITVPDNTVIVAPPSESEIQWVWGEVVSMDPAMKALTLKYLDYETDQEKDIVILADEKTTFENVKNLDGIKLQDTLSVDYTVSEGKNTAKNVSLEKPELPVESQEAPNEAPATETAPDTSSGSPVEEPQQQDAAPSNAAAAPAQQ